MALIWLHGQPRSTVKKKEHQYKGGADENNTPAPMWKNLGVLGDVVSVKPGYGGRNYASAPRDWPLTSLPGNLKGI